VNTGTNQVDADLRWRCRRGMLELDLLLNQFVNTDYVHLNEQETTLFHQLLDYPDPLLFDLLLGHMPSTDRNISQLVSRIRNAITA